MIPTPAPAGQYKLTRAASDNAKAFFVNEYPFAVSTVRVVEFGDKIGLAEIGEVNVWIIYPQPAVNFQDKDGNNFADKAALLTYLKDTIFS